MAWAGSGSAVASTHGPWDGVLWDTRCEMCACVERSLERRGVEPFLVRMEVQSIIRYVACLERDGEEWCAYHFPFMPEDVDPQTRPHLVRLAEREGL